MKLIRIVKLARVPYGELDKGDEYWLPHWNQGVTVAYDPCIGWYSRSYPAAVCPIDTTKYPPESVTYTIEGLVADSTEDGTVFIRMDSTPLSVSCNRFSAFNESEIETRCK